MFVHSPFEHGISRHLILCTIFALSRTICTLYMLFGCKCTHTKVMSARSTKRSRLNSRVCRVCVIIIMSAVNFEGDRKHGPNMHQTKPFADACQRTQYTHLSISVVFSGCCCCCPRTYLYAGMCLCTWSGCFGGWFPDSQTSTFRCTARNSSVRFVQHKTDRKHHNNSIIV